MDKPHYETLMAACEGMALLIRREYGEGPMAGDVSTFTEASVEQIAAVATLDAYWASQEEEPDPVRSLIQGFAQARQGAFPERYQVPPEKDRTDEPGPAPGGERM